MGKNIQLPDAAIRDMLLLILALDDYELDSETSAIVKRLEVVINVKVEAMEKRKAYTAYKTAFTCGERESARQRYLELVGMNDGWRWGAETEQKEH